MKKQEFYIFLSYINVSETTYYQRNREVILNKAKYYRNNTDELKVKARNKYRELSEEEKDIKREHGRNRYHNMSEEDKQRLNEYQKSYHWSRNAT